MKKQEYIEKYGEEYYNEYLKKCKQYNDTHKDERKRYRETHKDEIKQYRDTHKDEIKQKHKQYRETHKEKRNQQHKQYRETHKDEMMRYRKQYYNSPKGRAVSLAVQYNRIDKEKGFDTTNNIDYSYIVERIFTAKCIYCGDSEWRHLGCDRIDNNKPHTPDNVVCACGICNMERSDKKTVEEMIEYRTTNPRVLRNMNVPIEKTPTGAIKKRNYIR